MKPKRITAFLLSVAMILSLMPTFTLTASADETPTTTTEKNITLGTSALSGYDSTNEYKYVYYGTYDNSPIKWRILSMNGNGGTYYESIPYTPTTPPDSADLVDGKVYTDSDEATKFIYLAKNDKYYKESTSTPMFLLSEYGLEKIAYDSDGTMNNGQASVTDWRYSDAWNWCNDTTDDTSFIRSSFTDSEKAYFLKTSKDNECSPPTDELKGDTFFFLSEAETKKIMNEKQNLLAYMAASPNGNAVWWWLRSPNGHNYVSCVHILGSITFNNVTDVSRAARPAFNLNPASVLFTSAADGKSATDGTLFANAENTGNEYKLTMLDTNRKFTLTEKTARGIKGSTITLNYDKEQTGTNEYISAMIVKNSKVLYYGQGKTTDTSLNKDGTEKGKVKFTLPDNIADGEYTLYVFNEQINDNNNKTDFSSAFSDIALTIGLEGSGTETDPYLIYNLDELEYFRDKVNNGTYQSAYVKLMSDIDMSEKYGSNINGSEASWTPIGNETNPFNGKFSGGGHKIKNLYVNAISQYAGLFGYAGENSVIQRLGVTGSVKGTREYVGGIVGYTKGEITECYNTCTVTGSDWYVGGIAGCVERNDKTSITNCYNTGAISGMNRVAGIAGGLEYISSVQYCYNIGNVTATATGAYADGIGVNQANPSCVYSNNYYLTGTVSGHSGTTVSNASTVNKDWLKTTDTFVGWDFDDIWLMDDERPILRNCLEETGSKNYPYTISNLAELEAFRDDVNSGNTYAGKYVKLTADIDMSTKYSATTGTSWTPIGTTGNLYCGTFDGNSYTISNLYINISEDDIGLFGNLGAAAAIKNLAVEDGNITGNFNVGGVVATANNGNIIENCSYSGTIAATGNVGGIVGSINNRTIVKNCYSIAAVNATLSTAPAGGIVGNISNNCTISNNYYLSGSLNCTMTPGENSGEIETKSADQFASGEVAYLLQNGQEDKSTQVWGQTLTGNKKDSYPVLSSEEEKSVKKVSFKVKDSENEGQYKDYAVKYVNDGKTLSADFPADPDDKCEYWWSETANVNGTKFTKDTVITKDMTVYGVKKEITEASDKSDEITLNKNTEATIDLNDYVKNKSGNGKNFAFELVDGQTLPDGLQFDESTGKITGKPTKVGTYTVKFNVANNGIGLMSLESVNNVDVLTLTFNVDLEKDKTAVTTTYLIYNLDELEYFRDKVNSGKNYENECVKLADKLEGDVDYIDMSAKYNETTGKSWEPIGKNSASFKGTFDGNNKTIRGLYINDSSSDFTYDRGLFGYIYGATIKNLTVDGRVSGYNMFRAGGIVGSAKDTTIENCCNNANVNTDANDIGGIAAWLNGSTIRGCYNTGSISGAGYNIGGIAGESVNSSAVENCYNNGDVSTTYTGEAKIGGIVGYLSASRVKGCYNTGTVTAPSTATKVGGAVGYSSNGSVAAYYLDTCAGEHTTFDADTGKEKTAEEFANGEVAYLLQYGQTTQVWGQELNETDSTKNDKYPVLTSDAGKTVYMLELFENSSDHDDVDAYQTYKKVYMNDGDTVTLPDYAGTNSEYFYGWSKTRIVGTVEKTYTAKASDFNNRSATRFSIWNKVTFRDIDGTKQTYLADTPRKISFTPLLNGSTEGISSDDFEVKYYEVDENKKELKSITAVNAVSAGKYLYVIGFKEGSTVKAYIENPYSVTSVNLPTDISSYGNIGYMYITSGAETAQKPIYFEKQVVNAKMTDTVSNPLKNDNASTVTYTSSDESVATVDNSGNITIKGAGSTVIIATSTKENAADVYASYTLNVTKEVITVTAKDKSISYGDDFANDGYTVSKEGVTLEGTPRYTTDYTVGDGVGKYEINVSDLTSDLYEIEYKSGKLNVGAKELTADDFEVSVKNKTYDGSNKAEVTAKVKEDSLVSGDVVTVLVNGTFDKETVDASSVNYTITGLSGKDSSNYVVKNDISGSKKATVNKAKVTVSVPSYTSYVYDGEGKSVSVFAYANGIYFDKFDVTYNGNKTLPKDTGTYTVGITLTDDNYELDGAINATLEIKSAQQDVFSIEGISDSVTYGEELTLQTAGAITGGSVSYQITSGNELVTLDGNKITTKGIGTVTVKATSTMANYADKTATRTFVIKPKTISVTAEATNREYDGTKDIEVTLTPVGLVGNDSVTVTKTSATVATADVENNKTVFVSGLSIYNPNYQLSANSVQTSVNITKKQISNITLTAENKVYDGTKDVTGYTVTIADSDVVNADKDFVTVTGTAKFNSENVNDASKVTLSDLVLSGTKSGNYELKVASVDDTNAKITKATVNFEFGTLSYVYDGKAKTVPVTATVNGKAFDGYTVTYGGAKEQTSAGKYGIEVTLNDSDNYASDYTSKKQLEITTADQSSMTITGLLGTIEYGKTFRLTAVGGSSDITATWESSDASIATVSEAGVVTIVGTGRPVTITATKAANGNFNKQTANVTFTPVKKNVTFKITNLNQVYDGSAKFATVTTVAETYSVKYFDENNEEVTNPTNAGTYYVEVNATGNYEGEQSAVLTIKKAKRNTDNLSITIPENIVYGTAYDVTVNGYDGTDGVITYTGTGLYGGQTDKPTNAGSYTATLTISNDNYETATVTKKFEIAKATLYAKPDNQSRAYGEQNPVFTIKYYSDEACTNEVANADVMIAPVMSTSATASSGTDKTYDIVATGGYAENYTFVYVNGILTIGTATGGNFYISGGNTNPYVDNEFKLTAYYNNEKPNVTWTTSNDKIATVDKDGNVKIIDTGEVTITAKMNDSRFDNELTAEFKLTAARLPENQNAIIFDTPIVEKYANDDNFTIKPSNVSDGANVTYKSSNSGIASVNETTGEVTIKKVGTVVITATATKFNCPDVYATYTLSIKKFPVTITADNKTITYGEAFTGSATFSNGLEAKDFDGTLGFNTRYTVGKDVDEYDVTPTGLTSDKYDITFVSGTITVTEKKLTADDFIVTANGKTYDGTTDVEISASVKESAIVGNDKLYVEVEGAFEDKNVGNGKTVKYDITSLSGRGFENYVLDDTTGLTTTANIEKSEVTFFVSEETVKNYDGKAQSVEISAMASGNVFGSENYTVYYQKDGEEKTTEPKNVGEYNVSVELKDSDNYTVKAFTAKLIIEQDADVELEIKGSNKNVTVGDVFTLYAQYGNDKAEVSWSSSDEKVATVDDNGNVEILKSGDVEITATMKDENYNGLSADFELTASKKHINVSASATELVKVYNGKVQNITFTAGSTNLDDVKVDTTYVMTTDSSKTEPKDVGTYAVSYTIDDERYEGSGNFTLVINKATVTVSADSIEKEYGEAPVYKLIVSDNVEGINSETMKELVTVTSEGAAKTANVGEYGINVSLTKTSDENCNYVVNLDANGKLNVTKAPLTVNVEDITRECGKPNPTELTYTITGFKNGETADILAGSIAPVYAETIEEEVGTQKDVVTAASTLENGNYTVEVKYVDGEGADLTITKIAVNASAGTSRASYLTVVFDKAVEGVTFKVTDANGDVEVTSTTASSDNKTYTLNGTFTVGTEYTVEITYDNATQDISNKTLKITPTKQSSGGGGGGGGSSAATSYTVTFETNGGSKIDSVKVDKNKTVTEPTAPTKDGFEFDGWYSDKKLTTAYDFDAKVTKAVALYAKWTEKKIDDKKDDNKDDNHNPTPSEWKNSFTDVTKADWFFDNVRYANENGLMSGTTDTTFAPNDNLTRGMLVTVLYRAEGEPAANKSIPFADVNASKYYANAVIWAEQNGIVKGVTETEFAPDENITREQIATIIYRYAGYKGIAPTGAWAIKLDYADVADISDYAADGVMYCTMKNIMQGKDNNMFAPKDNATRAEIAAILNRFIESNK